MTMTKTVTTPGYAKPKVHGIWHQLWRTLLGGVLGAGLPAALHADTGLIAADQAPSAWLTYATLVKAGIEEALATDEALLHHMQQQTQQVATVRVWVSNQGKITAVAVVKPAGAAMTQMARLFHDRLVGLPLHQTPPTALRWPIVLQLDWREMPAEADSRHATPPTIPNQDAG